MVRQARKRIWMIRQMIEVLRPFLTLISDESHEAIDPKLFIYPRSRKLSKPVITLPAADSFVLNGPIGAEQAYGMTKGRWQLKLVSIKRQTTCA